MLGPQNYSESLKAGKRAVCFVTAFILLLAQPIMVGAQPDSPPELKPPIPVTTTPEPVQDADTSAVDQYDIFGKSSDNAAARRALEEVEAESIEATGTIFQTPEQIQVKAPLLKALISLEKPLSPYSLDALTARPINLADVVQTAYKNNLVIKISQTEVGAQKWNWISSLGNFLPTIAGETSYQGISGTYVSPAGLAIPIHTPAGYLNLNAGYSQFLYKGGGILHSALEAKHKYKASQFGLSGTINDVLIEATKKYYDLVLENVLLQIRIKATEVSKGLVIVNEDMFHEGVNTQLDLLQAKFQLSDDRQELISQQVKRREAAVKLATALNLDSGEDLMLRDKLVDKIRLVDRSLKPADLLIIAVNSRPDLQRHEQLRLAALEQIKVARSPLLPQITTSGGVTGTGARVKSLGSSSASTPLATTGGGTAGIGAVSTGGGGLPLSSDSGSGSPHWSTRALFLIGVDVQWTLGGLGVTQAAKVQSAKYEARQKQLEYLRTLNKVYEQVRDAYLSSMSAETLIAETTDQVKYATEGLRVAELRYKEGIGTYLDVLNAQKSYVKSLTSKAQSIIKFNTSQAELLYAIGRLSVSTATSTVPFKG
jgi:outer membrane protein TolC